MPRRLFACFARPSQPTDSAAVTSEAVISPATVVVELFTSQGCAASPAAEAVASTLGKKEKNKEDEGMPRVMVLVHHVDYWDHAGWKDPFGSSQATVRQKAYVEALRLDTMFTPQAVVQGGAHCIADDEDALLALVKGAQKFPALGFQAKFERSETTATLEVRVWGPLRRRERGEEEKGGNLMAALYESGLVTECGRGENKGRVLNNDFVVRRIEKLCSVAAKKNVSGNVSFALWSEFDPARCGLAVFLQDPSSYRIFGSQEFELPHDI